MLLRASSLLLRRAATAAPAAAAAPAAFSRTHAAPPLSLLCRGLASGRSIPPHKVYPQWTNPPPQHEYWRENTWLGAYYNLREGDAAAMRNREKLRGKHVRKRSRFIVSSLERIEQDKWEAQQPWRKGTWKPGTYLEVAHSSKVGETPDRVVGILIGKHRRGLGSSFRLLTAVDNTPVEYQFMLYSPLISEVIVRRESDWRDNKRKLYSLREEVRRLNFPRSVAAEEKFAAATALKEAKKKAKKR